MIRAVLTPLPPISVAPPSPERPADAANLRETKGVHSGGLTLDRRRLGVDSRSSPAPQYASPARPGRSVALRRLAFLAGLLALPPSTANAASLFTKVDNGSAFPGLSLNADTDQGGMLFADLDNDGDEDLVLLRDAASGPLVLRNDSTVTNGVTAFRFGEEVGALPGQLMNSVTRFPTGVIAAGDMDNDGDVDLAATDQVTGVGLWVWENNLIDGGYGTPTSTAPFSFKLVTADLALSSVPGRTVGIVWLDIEADGDLDLAVDGPDSTRRLYINQLSAGFMGFSLASGNVNPDSVSGGHDLTAVDLNLDGYPELIGRSWPALNNSYDIVYWNDRGYLSDANGSRVAFDTAVSGPSNGTGVSTAWFDYDNDGDFDSIFQNTGTSSGNLIFTTRFFANKYTVGSSVTFTFSDRNPTGDLGVTFPTWFGTSDFGAGIAIGDLNQDGRLDVVYGNPSSTDPDKLFLNQGSTVSGRPWQFQDASSNETALASTTLGDSEGLGLSDLDSDGDLDLFIQQDKSAPVLLQNSSASTNHNYVNVRVTCNNRDCINATVQLFKGGDMDGDGIPEAWVPGMPGAITYNGRDYGVLSNSVYPGSLLGMQTVAGGGGIGGQSSPILHFGVPDLGSYYTLRVVFPGGKVILKDIQPTRLSEKYHGKTLSQFITLDQSLSTEDGDGLPAIIESNLGTSSLDLDSDDDGVLDYTETQTYKTKADQADSDSDGLTDNQELGINTSLPDLDGSGPLKGTDLTRQKLDSDTTSKTDPLKSDTDGDGLPDGTEDSNRDGKYDLTFNNSLYETHPLDQDSDDDGILDGVEVNGYKPTASENAAQASYKSHPRLTDTDGDGLSDALEIGLQVPQAQTPPTGILGTDLTASLFVPDASDLGTRTTDPSLKDTDGDGLNDGTEDLNRNGAWDSRSPQSETDPTRSSSDNGCDQDGYEISHNSNPLDGNDDTCSDPDGDGLNNAQESTYGTNPLSTDSDKDGVSDGVEASSGTNALQADSDKDGLGDGLEDTNQDGARNKDASGRYIETDPRLKDSDGDSIADGTEDLNRNGHQDSGESDPSDRDTDDDGLTDQKEDYNFNGMLDSSETSATRFDTDGDGLSDGLEVGVVSGNSDSDPARFIPDSDPSTTTNPLNPDSDGDALVDGQEDLNLNGRLDSTETDPNRADTDGDGLSDGLERTLYQTNPLDRDSDHDGLTDDYELTRGLNPTQSDSDGDGLNDGQEVQDTLTDPLKSDTDMDQLSDSEELALGSNPRMPDSDGDGLKDGIEVQNANEPTSPIAEDTDQDGISDAVEVAAFCQLDARDPDSDHDGIRDGIEDFVNHDCHYDPNFNELNPLDDDTDDDGLCDGAEAMPNASPGATGAGANSLPYANMADSDADGLQDGTELGLTAPLCLGTRREIFIPDADGATHTNPRQLDSDGDGLGDGQEDVNHDGAQAQSETDPTRADSDNDGLNDGAELKTYHSNPLLADTDGGCQNDGDEIKAGHDPVQNPSDDDCADVDHDGLSNLFELTRFRSDPNDADSDDDGVLDGDEPGLVDTDRDGKVDAWATSLEGELLDETGVQDASSPVYLLSWRLEPGDLDGDGQNSLLDPDSDNDGILDGTELGIYQVNAQLNPDGSQPTLVSRHHYVADADQGQTVTDPLLKDSDGGGARDGAEDPNHNGRQDASELNPVNADDDGAADQFARALPTLAWRVPGRDSTEVCAQGSRVQDSDCDGLTDQEETAFNVGTRVLLDIYDADSDDDGIPDGAEDNPSMDTDGDGLPNPADPDADNDGLFDGVERGLTTGSVGTDPKLFVADADPNTSTSMVLRDTDFGGAPDGAEDPDHDGSQALITTGNARLDETLLDDATNGNTLEGPNGRVPSDDLPMNTYGAQTQACLADTFFSDLDCDGLTDQEEAYLLTNALDADSDDDGLLDSLEDNPSADTDRDGIPNLLDCDADNDALPDGLERGVQVVMRTGITGTDTSAGCFTRDDDPTTRTSMLLLDSDGGGATDGEEDLNHNGVVDSNNDDLEPDPNDPGDDCPDSDRDRLCNDEELRTGTDPNDADSDDDGLIDSAEGSSSSPWDDDADGDGLINALDPDADNDGLVDGIERSVPISKLSSDTDLTRGLFREDLDPSTQTDPTLEDSDADLIPDGAEDANADGNSYNDPAQSTVTECGDGLRIQDTDCDALSDAQEKAFGLDPFDADSDDDGVLDGDEDNWRLDSDGDGKCNALDADSDNDELPDGLERGVTGSTVRLDMGSAHATDLAAGNYKGDADPSQTTFMLLPDSDGDRFEDGEEDCNRNGKVDCLESDPQKALDPAPGTAVGVCEDTDGDGFTDLIESRLGMNATSTDSDADGLLDAVEANPVELEETQCILSAPDTDGDGTIDAIDQDSDGDGRTDAQELGADGRPLDTDGDGIPDHLDAHDETPTPSPTPVSECADKDIIECTFGCSCNQGPTAPPVGLPGSLLTILAAAFLSRRRSHHTR